MKTSMMFAAWERCQGFDFETPCGQDGRRGAACSSQTPTEEATREETRSTEGFRWLRCETDLEGRKMWKYGWWLMILMKWKFMLIGLVERFGGPCIRSCGPNSQQQLFFPGVSAGGAIGFVWAYRFWHESPSWPWVTSSLYYSLLLSYPWLQVIKINMQLKMQTCQRLGREFLNRSRLLWFVFPLFNMTRWKKD